MNQSISSSIEEAHRLIEKDIHRTAVLTSDSLNKLLNVELFFKCENFQKIGAFKMRGASHFIHKLAKKHELSGLKVVTHSSGNHAQAVALAAKKKGIKAFIVMPSNAPKVKVEGVKSYGAEIVFCEPTLQAREAEMNKIREREKAVFIPPYDHEDIVLGQATAAKELLEEVVDLEILMAPVGGGGLLAGTALSAKAYSPATIVIGCEPKMADDAYRSFHSGKWVPSTNPKTLADGLKTSLGELNFRLIMENVEDIICCTEEGMINAMQLIWERMKIVVEPSAAVPLACILENEELFRNKKVGIILSGGNVDLNEFFDLLSTKIQS